MSDLFKTANRGYLIDHHSPAPPTVTLDKLKIEEYEAFFKEADINSLMLYTKDHWGYSYYDTKVGVRHPGLKRDFVADVAAVLSKLKIEFNAYYCLEYDVLAPQMHPEWAIRDQEGQAVFLKGRMPKWGMPCYETGYRQYVLDQLVEVVSGYHPDSLFLDIFGKSLCYCDCCRAKFLREYGYDLPVPEGGQKVVDEFSRLDFGDKGRDVNQFLENCAAGMLEDIKSTLKAIDPTLKITINFSALYPKRIRDMLDYQFTEPWAGNWLSAAYARDTAVGQYPQLGPGDVSEVYNYHHDAVYELAVAQITANGCRAFMYSGSQHVDGTLEQVEAQKVGRAFRQVEQYEEYLQDRKIVADIAIIQSEASILAKSGQDVVPNAIGRCKRIDQHRQAVLGAMTLCDQSGFTWQVLPEQSVTSQVLSGYKCVILAGVYTILPALKAALEAFSAGGGAILADGQTGLYSQEGSLQPDFSLSQIFGCTFDKVLDEYKDAPWGAYMSLRGGDFWQQTPTTTPALPSEQYGVQLSGGKALGEIVMPCTKLTETTWVNWWCPPPQSQASAYPAVVQKDQCIYLAFDFFAQAQNGFWLSGDIFADLLSQVIPKPLFRLKTTTPKALSYVVYQHHNQLVIHEISQLAEHLHGQPPVIDGGQLEILHTAYPNLKATLVYPEQQPLRVSRSGDYYQIDLPALSIHQILVLE